MAFRDLLDGEIPWSVVFCKNKNCRLFLFLSVALDFFVTSNPIYHLLSDMEKEELRNFTQEFLEELAKKSSGKLINESTRILIHAYKAPRKIEK